MTSFKNIKKILPMTNFWMVVHCIEIHAEWYMWYFKGTLPLKYL